MFGYKNKNMAKIRLNHIILCPQNKNPPETYVLCTFHLSIYHQPTLSLVSNLSVIYCLSVPKLSCNYVY